MSIKNFSFFNFMGHSESEVTYFKQNMMRKRACIENIKTFLIGKYVPKI